MPVRLEHHSTPPALTHVHGSGRLQTVFRDTNPLYYSMIERFGQATGVPAVLNTSFSLKDAPMITSPEDAYSTCRRSDMDLLVIGNLLVRKV